MIHKMILVKAQLHVNLDCPETQLPSMPRLHVPVIKREPVETTIDPYLVNIAQMLERAHELKVELLSSAELKPKSRNRDFQ